MAKRKTFTRKQITEWFLKHEGICHICGGKIMPGQKWDREHVIPLALGGDDTLENQRPAHETPCHRDKTKKDKADIAKSDRIRANHLGVPKKRKGRGWPCGKGSKFKKKLDGSVVPR